VKGLSNISENLRKLVEFYPKHIEKEDKVFFPAARAYVTDSEDQAMLAEFWEFDRRMIHEKYRFLGLNHRLSGWELDYFLQFDFN
jgi:hemerythrin-like domain-containing protein